MTWPYSVDIKDIKVIFSFLFYILLTEWVTNWTNTADRFKLTLCPAVRGKSPLQYILGKMLNYRSCSVQKIALILIALLVFLNPKLIWDLYMVDCCWLLCTVQMGWACFTSIKRATANRGHLLTLRSEIREKERESKREWTRNCLYISISVYTSICTTVTYCAIFYLSNSSRLSIYHLFPASFWFSRVHLNLHHTLPNSFLLLFGYIFVALLFIRHILDVCRLCKVFISVK